MDRVITRFIHLLAAFGAVLLLVGGNAQAETKLLVFVSIEPQKYFVQQIGQALVDVEVMIPAGADPHTYEPKPRQMVALSKARLYFAIGLQPFEDIWLKKIASSNPDMKVVHTDSGIQKIPMSTGLHKDDLDLMVFCIINQLLELGRLGVLALDFNRHLFQTVSLRKISPGRVQDHKLKPLLAGKNIL